MIVNSEGDVLTIVPLVAIALVVAVVTAMLVIFEGTAEALAAGSDCVGTVDGSELPVLPPHAAKLTETSEKTARFNRCLLLTVHFSESAEKIIKDLTIPLQNTYNC